MAKGNSNGKPGSEKAVLYLRMSSAKQDASIDQQRDQLTSYAAQHGYTVTKEYTDSAISGDDTARRTEFLRMRDDAAKGEFSVVLCWDQDRFGRFDPIEGGYWILPFRDAGVRLETIAQGRIDWTDFAGRLLYVVQQEAKHAYLRDLSRNVARGQLPGASLTGQVTRTSDSLDPGNRTLRIEIDIANPEGRLKPGTYLQAELEVAKRKDVLALPHAAILTHDKSTFCLTVDDQGKVAQVPVQLGIQAGADVEILSGLSGSERIITANVGGFREGQIVQAVTETAAK